MLHACRVQFCFTRCPCEAIEAAHSQLKQLAMDRSFFSSE